MSMPVVENEKNESSLCYKLAWSARKSRILRPIPRDMVRVSRMLRSVLSK